MKVTLLRNLMVGEHNVIPSPRGSEVELPDADAKDLIERGLAEAGDGTKSAPTPKNKKASEPRNKSASGEAD